MLKTCVILPIDDESPQVKNDTPFKRGVMSFEDYNYKGYNNFILVTKDNPHSETTSLMRQKIELTEQNISKAKLLDYDHESIA